MIVVVLFTIFLMALVSLNSDYRVAVTFRKVVRRKCLYSFDMFRGRNLSLACNESCRKFSVDGQDVFIYYIWLSESKVMVPTASNSGN
jgi:hypothetical protein